jgi:hypothetical protein
MRSDDIIDARPAGFPGKLKALLIGGALAAVAVLVAFLLTWNAFFKYVPQGKHLVVIAKNGNSLAPGHILADEGEQGVQRKVLGEGWHFVMPIANETVVEDNTEIPAGKVGIVTALGGDPLPSGVILATKDNEQGIQKHVLPPGNYRLNLHGYKVEMVDAVKVEAGFVGVQNRLLGVDGTSRFAEKPEEKGILRQLLQPGLYYINSREYEIIKSEVGIEQTSFHAADKDNPRDTSIEFTSRGGFKIKIDCTIEWEVLPQDMPALVAEFGTRTAGGSVYADQQKVENIVIVQQAQAIIRDKGIEYGVQDLLIGNNREKFQADFTKELKERSKTRNVVLHSAFIRNIDIPDQYMKEIRDKQIAAETNLTNKYLEETKRSDAEVKKEQTTIEKKVKDVGYETQKMVTAIDTEASNIKTLNAAEIERLDQEYQAKIAAIDAQSTLEVGTAKNDVTKLTETAKSNLYKLKMEVFQNDGDAFLRYSMADQLSPNLKVRLFHSGPGTFWTNMDGKNMNLLIPTPGSSTNEKVVAPTKPVVGPNIVDKGTDKK